MRQQTSQYFWQECGSLKTLLNVVQEAKDGAMRPPAIDHLPAPLEDQAGPSLLDNPVVRRQPPGHVSEQPKPVPHTVNMEGSGNHMVAPAPPQETAARPAGASGAGIGDGLPETEADRFQRPAGMGLVEAAGEGGDWQVGEPQGEASEGQGRSGEACTIQDEKVASLAQQGWAQNQGNPTQASPTRSEVRDSSAWHSRCLLH